MNKEFLTAVSQNVLFVIVFLGIVLAMFFIAYLFEKAAKKRNNDLTRILTTRKMAMVGMFSAIALILHIFDFSIPFLAPPFYRLDFSELPALIGAFAFGPVAGVLIESLKILLKLVIKGTSTAFVGDLANFVIGCSFILPASIIYDFKKSKKNAIVSCVIATLIITMVGTIFNAVYLLPTFAVLYGMKLEDIIAMGTAVNSNINNVTTFAIIAVAPVNLIKGSMVSLLTLLMYKKISPILKSK